MGKKSREKWARRLEKATQQPADPAPVAVPPPQPATAAPRNVVAGPRIISRYADRQQLIDLGPMVYARWSFPASHTAALEKLGRAVPSPFFGVMLVDTGATFTSIDLEIARTLGLKQTGFANTYGAHGLQQSPMFEAHCGVEVEHNGTPNRFLEADLQVTGIADLKKSGDARGLTRSGAPVSLIGLLGRDFLQLGKLIYDGTTAIVTIELHPTVGAILDQEAAAAAAACAPSTVGAKPN